MNLINFKIEKDNKGTEYVKRIERDTRPVVDRLYGINIPAYPFTFASMGKELQKAEIINSTSILEYEDLVTRTIDETREDFRKQVAERFPAEEEHKKNEAVGDLMQRYVAGVFGDERHIHTLDKETESILYSSDALLYAFIIHRVQMIKEGHAVIKMLMLKRIFFPTCQVLLFSADYEHLYIMDEVNTTSELFDTPILIDITEEVYKIMCDYEVIHPCFHSLGEFIKNCYRGTEDEDIASRAAEDIEEGVHEVADALALILFGYTDNDCIRIDVAHTGKQHMNNLLERAVQKHTSIKEILVLAQMVADDVLAQQKNAQNATGAD